MNRRAILTLLGGAASWPLQARAQREERLKRIGVIMGYRQDDPEAQALIAKLTASLRDRGWTDGHNIQMTVHWTNGASDPPQKLVQELLSLQPDLVLAQSTPVTAALQRETRTIPIIFAIVSDPVGDGFVNSLSHPGGNITGLINVEASMGGKWLQLAKEIAPSLTNASIMFNPKTAAGAGSYFRPSFETAASALGVQAMAHPVHDENEIEAAIIELSAMPSSGLVVMTDSFTSAHRRKIISSAARTRVPAVYPSKVFAKEGGLLSYGASNLDLFRRAGDYVDHVLRGVSPADLPVQLPVRFELVINLRTARALGITVPPTMLARADEVIE